MPLPASEWERCRGWIEAALEYAGGTHEIGDVWDAIATGRAHLLALKRSVMVVEVIEYPRLRVLHIWLGGGDMAELKAHVDEQMPRMARALGCSRIRISGRRGWVLELRDIGFSELCTTIMRNAEWQ